MPISSGHNYFLQGRGNGQERGPKAPFALIAAHRKQRLETGPGPGGDWGGVRGRRAGLINNAGLRTGHWTPTGAGPTQSLLLTVLVGNPTLSWGPLSQSLVTALGNSTIPRGCSVTLNSCYCRCLQLDSFLGLACHSELLLLLVTSLFLRVVPLH